MATPLAISAAFQTAPNLHYPLLKIQFYEQASLIGTEDFEGGYESTNHVTSTADLAKKPVVSAATTADAFATAPASRLILKRTVELAGNSSAGSVEKFKENNRLVGAAAKWDRECREILLVSLGPDIASQLTDNNGSLAGLKTWELMDMLDQLYSAHSISDHSALIQRLCSPFDPAQNFLGQVRKQKQLFSIALTYAAPFSNPCQLHYLVQAIQHWPAALDALQKFQLDGRHGDVQRFSYDDLSQFIHEYLRMSHTVTATTAPQRLDSAYAAAFAAGKASVTPSTRVTTQPRGTHPGMKPYCALCGEGKHWSTNCSAPQMTAKDSTGNFLYSRKFRKAIVPGLYHSVASHGYVPS